jgi:hypothetical protein
MRKLLPKLAVAILILAGLGWLFLKTVRDTNAEPYIVDAAELSGWTLAIENPELGGPGLLVLQPPVSLVADVFRQIFQRSGQSLAGPSRASMPLILHAEYASTLKGVLSPDELLEAARKAGLERERLLPVCMGILRTSTSGRVNQRFFLLFDSDGFGQFRGGVAKIHQSKGGVGTFDAAALRPIVPVASFEPDFHLWQWPLQFDQAADCQTPLSGSS